jgi:ADP-heptose:LPS heptosyltransferase
LPSKFAFVVAPVIAPFLIRRGKAAAAEGRHRAAAILFEEALRLQPRRARLRIQCGHMRKEAAEFGLAEAHYLAALDELPDDADLALQLGHLYKIVGRLDEADAQYRRAAGLRPEWDQPRIELERLRRIGWLNRPVAAEPDPAAESHGRPASAGEKPDDAARARLVPELAPRRPEDLVATVEAHLHIRRLGFRETSRWGDHRTLRGVSAIHGYCVSEHPIVEVQVIVNGLAIHRGPPAGGYRLHLAPAGDRHRKYVFNIWLDFTPFTAGVHMIEVRCRRADGEAYAFHEDVVIAPPRAEAEDPGSDALIVLSPDDARPIEAQIRARPSIVRAAKRALFPDGVRNILVLRTDQLGDMIASIPALRRLRELAPDARIVGLLTAANADLARTLGLFDEIVVVDFPDDPIERRRIMPLREQEALRDKLAPYAFDIALDLAISDVSRGLLPLSGAKFLYGTGGGDWPFLTADFTLNTHDRYSRMDIVPHSAKVLAMIEGLGALLRGTAPIVRRPELSRASLEPHGIGPDDRFAVLHMGARVAFSRWPHFPMLVSLLLQHTDLKIVLMADGPAARQAMPPELLASDRVLLLDDRLPFDTFDAFVSCAEVLVGNDSGPKHLAALRGTNVVTLFTGRINWQEWGQENVGAIVSRKVPCQGCAIFHDSEDCGRGFACITDIAPQEVFDTVARYL